MSKEELFLIINANYCKSMYDTKNELRVLSCNPMYKEVFVNSINPFLKALDVKVKEEALTKPTGEKFIKRSFVYEEVTFYDYYEN